MDISGISKMSSSNVVSVNPNQLEIYADSITLKNLATGDKAREDIRDEGALKRHQAAVKASFERAICGLPKPGKVNVSITKTFTTGNLVCESLVLETLPGYFATANVYKPTDSKGELPAVLMVCGHSAEGRMETVYQRVQRTIASAGFVVMGLDPIGQGERYSYLEDGRKTPCIPPCTKEHDYAGIQCLLAGITVTRYFVHDGICALDYLAARDDVDAAKIGVTGSSGGGTQTSMLMMAAPEKIAAAAPGTFITDRKAILYSRQAQDAEQIWPGMVKDGFDHVDAFACMAPKPVMLLAVDSDFFPLEGSNRTMEKAKKLWALSGNEDKLEICTDASGHAYTFMLANAAADFFSRALKGVP
ncbi:MAG: prolyl oligopeptidase family serine peptidase, partial [Eubacteriales bacterium]